MKLLSTYLRGKSLTVCFAFPEDYDMANIEALNVSIGSKQFAGDDIDISGQVACVKLKSEDTYKLTGDYPIIISIDDKTRGVIPIYVGDIRFVTHRNSLNNASTNEQNDIVIALSITQTTINVDSVLYDVMKGVKGDAGTIEVGTVTTGDAGTDVIVENVGTSSEAVLNFTIPRGDAGYTPYIGVNGNWFINGVDTGVQAEGDATEAWVTQNYLSKLDVVGELGTSETKVVNQKRVKDLSIIGYKYLGIATTSTVPATYGLYDRVYYTIELATGETVLTNFALTITVSLPTLIYLKWNGTAWIYTGETVLLRSNIKNDILGVSSIQPISQAAVVTLSASGYLYLGIATTSTVPATYGVYERKYYLIELAAGTTELTNFGLAPITVNTATRYAIKWNGTAWVAEAEGTLQKNAQQYYNVTFNTPLSEGNFYTPAAARAAVPASIRKFGMLITYETSTGLWVIEQFKGTTTDTTAWNSEANWKSIKERNWVKNQNAAYSLAFKQAIAGLRYLKLNFWRGLEFTDVLTLNKFNRSGTNIQISIFKNGASFITLTVSESNNLIKGEINSTNYALDYEIVMETDGVSPLTLNTASNILVISPEVISICAFTTRDLKSMKYEVLTQTVDAYGAIVSGTVKWEDGSTGVYTSTDYNATWYCYDGYSVTHVASGKKIVQAAVTRNSIGVITTRPEITVTTI